MGMVCFRIPDGLSPTAQAGLESATLGGGYDLTPVVTRLSFEGNRLILKKDANESSYLLLRWPLEGIGRPLAISATLRERSEPYALLTELARGRINSLRNQVAEWQPIGLELDPEDQSELSSLTRAFGKCVLDANPTAADATDLLKRAFHLSERITQSFSTQLLETRLSEGGKFRTRFGHRLSAIPRPEHREQVLRDANAFRLVPNWRAIEPRESDYHWAEFDELVHWAVASGKAVSIGPIIDLSEEMIPDWLKPWGGDLPSLTAFLCDFSETILRRYEDRVTTWQIFSGFNHADLCGLGEDDRLRLAARLMDSARQTIPAGQWSIALSQPWGDYLTYEEYTYSPIVFADTLLRAGFNLAGLELELSCGNSPRASIPRDPLETYRLVELFSVLNVPLEVSVRGGPGPEVSDCPPRWAESTVSLTLALPQVQAVYLDLNENNTPDGPFPTPGLIRTLRERYIQEG